MARKYKKGQPLTNFLLLSKLFFRKFLIGFFVIGGVLLFILDRIGHPAIETVRTHTIDVVDPVMELSTAPVTWYHQVSDVVVSWFYTGAEIAELRKENNRLKHLKHVVGSIELENQRLREVLNMAKDIKQSYITAPITGSIYNVYDHTLFIDVKGEKTFEKNAVVLAHNAVVGRILEVGNRLARVQLLTDIDSRIPVITSDSQTRAVLFGTNTDTPLLKRMPSNHTLEVGERVLSSGDGGAFPAGILVGEIIKIDEEHVELQPYVDPLEIDYVHVLH